MKADPLSFSVVRRFIVPGQNVPKSAQVPPEHIIEVPPRKRKSVLFPMVAGLALISVPIAGTVKSATLAAKLANKYHASVENTLMAATSAVKSIIK